VLPISSLSLNYPVGEDRVSTGIDRLDSMLGGKGYYRGSSILISGTAGTGKSSIAVAFADRTCRSGGKCLYLSFEESPEQIVRNMKSIGFNLDQWRKKGLLSFSSARPTLYGLGMHLASIHKKVNDFKPEAVIMDPITNMLSIAGFSEVEGMLARAIDFLKRQGITSIFTSLTHGGEALEETGVGISSLMDTWLLLKMVESEGERNRLLYLLKSRGMSHPNQMREFVLTNKGIDLVDVYAGPGQVFTGSARLTQEAKDRAQALANQQASEQRKRELQQEQSNLQAQVETITKRLKSIGSELQAKEQYDLERQKKAAAESEQLSKSRSAD
jgi:circadian clock protein KaiC